MTYNEILIGGMDMNREEIQHYLVQYYEDCTLKRRLNAKTIKAYKIDLKQFLDMMEENDYTDHAALRDYVYQLNRQYDKYKTVKRKLASVKAFYHYLEYETIIIDNPFHKIKTQCREPLLLPRTISSQQLRAIFSCVYDDLEHARSDFAFKYHMRNVVLLELLFTTGMRISELCGLRKEEIDLKERTVKIFGKGAKERMLYLGNDEVVELLKRYMQSIVQDRASPYFFVNKYGEKLSDQSVRNLLHMLERRLGFSKPLTPHMFRHTFATCLLEKDVDIRYIQKILGHSSIAITQIYAHVTSTKQKEILTLKNPRNDYNRFDKRIH